MSNHVLASAYVKEMEAEYTATKKCLERIPESTYEFKPHEKSMKMGYLTLLVAEIPLWVHHTIETGVIDFQTYQHIEPQNTEQMLAHFEDNFQKAIASLKNATPEIFERPFYLKNGDQILMETPTGDSVGSTINHWVHHRGQLTVYMRLNDIAVPSIYGPSADDRNF